MDVIDQETRRAARIIPTADALAQVEAELGDRALWVGVTAPPDSALWAVEQLAGPGEWAEGLARAREDGHLDSVADLCVRRGPGWRVVLALVEAGPDREERAREKARARKARFRARRVAAAQAAMLDEAQANEGRADSPVAIDSSHGPSSSEAQA